MAAIDLLFDHKSDSERLHQVLLSVLLLRSRLLERVLGVPGLQALDFDWEPERRLYDLAFTVQDPSGGIDRVLVELKVDSGLEQEQFERQLAHLRDKAPKSRLVYLVLGLSAITVTEPRLTQWSAKLLPPREPTAPPLWFRCDAAELSQYLADPELLSGLDQASRRDVRDLASAYRDALQSLSDRTRRFATTPPARWRDPDFYGFFADCRSRDDIGHMRTANISYEANPKSGFIACNWLWTPISPGEPLRLYLQLENAKLCLKLKVPEEQKSQRRQLWIAAQAALRTLAPKPSIELVESNYHNGVHMTFAAVPDVFASGQLDLNLFKAQVTAAEAVLTKLAEKLKPAP